MHQSNWPLSKEGKGKGAGEESGACFYDSSWSRGAEDRTKEKYLLLKERKKERKEVGRTSNAFKRMPLIIPL